MVNEEHPGLRYRELLVREKVEERESLGRVTALNNSEDMCTKPKFGIDHIAPKTAPHTSYWGLSKIEHRSYFINFF